jgi:hypothetical protein
MTLAALLVALAVVVVVRVLPALAPPVATSGGGEVKIGSYAVPALGWDRSGKRVVPTPGALRSLFTFGAPPTPTPDSRPTPTKPPPPPPMPTPTPVCFPSAKGGCLPAPPQFTLSYLGWLGPNRMPVAVFRDGDAVVAVPVGETVKQKFIVREVGPTAVTVGFTGYAATVTSQVPLAR